MPPKSVATVTPPPAQSTDAKLDNLIATVAAIAQSQQEMKSLLETSLQRLTNVEQQVSTLNLNQSAVTEHLAAHDRDISTLMIATNTSDQLHRVNNIRILGYPVLEDETVAANDGGRFLRDKIFNRIIRPVLDVAVRDRFILSPPSAEETIMKIYRTGRSSVGGSPPPILVVFSSPLLRQALFRYKSKHLPPPNTVEKAAGAKRFYVVEDLTKATHKLLKLLQADERVAKVWSMDGFIRFTRTGDDTIRRVSNVFEAVDKILEG